MEGWPVVLYKAQSAVDVEAIDDDRWRGGGKFALPLLQNPAVVINRGFGSQSANDSKCRHLLGLAAALV